MSRQAALLSPIAALAGALVVASTVSTVGVAGDPFAARAFQPDGGDDGGAGPGNLASERILEGAAQRAVRAGSLEGPDPAVPGVLSEYAGLVAAAAAELARGGLGKFPAPPVGGAFDRAELKTPAELAKVKFGPEEPNGYNGKRKASAACMCRRRRGLRLCATPAGLGWAGQTTFA